MDVSLEAGHRKWHGDNCDLKLHAIGGCNVTKEILV